MGQTPATHLAGRKAAGDVASASDVHQQRCAFNRHAAKPMEDWQERHDLDSDYEKVESVADQGDEFVVLFVGELREPCRRIDTI